MVFAYPGAWLFVGIIVLVCLVHSPLSRTLTLSVPVLIGLVLLLLSGRIIVFLLASFLSFVFLFGFYIWSSDKVKIRW